MLMLHQDTRSQELLRPMKQARLHLSWKQYATRVVCLNIESYSNRIMVLNLKVT